MGKGARGGGDLRAHAQGAFIITVIANRHTWRGHTYILSHISGVIKIEGKFRRRWIVSLRVSPWKKPNLVVVWYDTVQPEGWRARGIQILGAYGQGNWFLIFVSYVAGSKSDCAWCALTPKEELGIVLFWKGKWKCVTLGQYFWEKSFNFEGRKDIDAFVTSHSGGMNLDQSLHTYVNILSARNSSVTCYSCLSSDGRGCPGGVLRWLGRGAGSLLCSVLCRWEVAMCCCRFLVLQLGRHQPNVAVKRLLEE